MAKILKIKFPEKCIGCELCIFEVQRQLNKIGLEGAPIRIFKNKEERILLGDVVFSIDLDKSVNELKLKRILEVCPTGVFEIAEIDNEAEAEGFLE